MQILITGGTGFIGKALVKQLIPSHVTVLTRSADKARAQFKHLNNNTYDLIESLDELKDLSAFDAIVNLAGEPIADRRWSSLQKKRICDSRWDVTEKLVSLMHASETPPKVFISGSAVGIYGDQQHNTVDERSEYPEQGFPHKVCAQWEEIAMQAQNDQTRVCLLRTGIVLGSNGGALGKMLLPYKLGLGGPLGSGKQYMPWIHIQDMVRAIQFLIESPQAQGVFNLTAPHPVPNKEFSQTLAKTLSRPHFLFTPQPMMKLLMGESSCLLFDSVNAKPVRLTEMGFKFTYSRLQPALQQILN
ncbi:cell division inhibitor [Vibrio ishigakensis]|uniref:Cell division inhibitor n=1 Tax=Vibrio ishigakensis TaxID=1481914 RepID=A0A0B8Q3M4_9VIBR|nr:cell division inhibitor [Vibrio ishigakensis]